MKKSTYSPMMITYILKEFEHGKRIARSREHGISRATFYNWRHQYSPISFRKILYLNDQTMPRPALITVCIDYLSKTPYHSKPLLFSRNKTEFFLTLKHGFLPVASE